MADRDPGLYVPTTSVWDVSEIYSTDVTKPEFKELLVRMYQNLNNMSMATNNKDSALYDTEEFVNGQTFFSDPGIKSKDQPNPERRNVFRKTINFGALPAAAGHTDVAHHIDMVSGAILNAGFTFTRIYGCTSDPVNGFYLPIPYASSVAADIIELRVDRTNVRITVGKDMHTYTATYVVLEYLKQ